MQHGPLTMAGFTKEKAALPIISVLKLQDFDI
jgi:hypothetical protein